MANSDKDSAAATVMLTDDEKRRIRLEEIFRAEVRRELKAIEPLSVPPKTAMVIAKLVVHFMGAFFYSFVGFDWGVRLLPKQT